MVGLQRLFALFGVWLVLLGCFVHAHDPADAEGGAAGVDGMDDMGDMDEEGGDDEGGDMDGMDGMGGGGMPASKPLVELKTLNEFDDFLNATDASCIGAFPRGEKFDDPNAKRPADWDDEEDGEWEPPTIENPDIKAFKEVASSLPGHRFAWTTAKDVVDKVKAKKDSLYLYRSPRYLSKDHGDRARERYPSDTIAKTTVQHWLESKSQPLVGEFNVYTESRYSSPTLIIYMHLDWSENVKNVNYVLKRARKVAVNFKGKLAFAVADHMHGANDIEDYGLSKTKDSEILMAIREGSSYAATKPKRYKPASAAAFSADSLTAFANSYLAGEIKPYEKPKEDPKKVPTKADEAAAKAGPGGDEM